MDAVTVCPLWLLNTQSSFLHVSANFMAINELRLFMSVCFSWMCLVPPWEQKTYFVTAQSGSSFQPNTQHSAWHICSSMSANTQIKGQMINTCQCVTWHYSSWIPTSVSSAPIPVLPAPHLKKVGCTGQLVWVCVQTSRLERQQNVGKNGPLSLFYSLIWDGKKRKEKVKRKVKHKIRVQELRERQAERRKMAEQKPKFLTYSLMKIVSFNV